jgi:hypothetical protein
MDVLAKASVRLPARVGEVNPDKEGTNRGNLEDARFSVLLEELDRVNEILRKHNLS